MDNFISDISGKEFSESVKINAKVVRPAIMQKIKEKHPNFSENGLLASSELNEFRNLYIESTMQDELGSLSHLESEVLEALKQNQIISDNIDETIDENLTFGQKLADHIASFGGSWTFISFFFAFLFLWIIVNVFLLSTKAYDPYPFILLNLILSCLAALQAPLIMMSQNRLEEKDRLRAKHDYQVNLKAEVEIRMLHEKMDHLILDQQQRLFEIQHIQVEMLKEITERLEKTP
jgi:uncharacterized membrane protein